MKRQPKRRRGPQPSRPISIGQVVIPSLGTLARGTGVDPSYLSRILSGQRLRSVETLSRIAGFLGVSLDRMWQFVSEESRHRGGHGRSLP